MDIYNVRKGEKISLLKESYLIYSANSNNVYCTESKSAQLLWLKGNLTIDWNNVERLFHDYYFPDML